MSSTLNRLQADAKHILNTVWNLEPGKHALVAHRWLKSEDGFSAFSDYALGMNAATTEAEARLVSEIFALRVEVASRRAGWRIELESAIDPRDLNTDC